jgi:ABC-type glycerol-3-phosphate transport system substrate-binding protein
LGIPAAALQGVTIQFWHPWSGSLEEAIRASAEGFNAGNGLGITVEARSLGNYNDLYAALQAAESSEELPHLALGYTYQLLAWQEELVELAPYLGDPEWGLGPAGLDAFNPLFLEQDRFGGERLAFPALRFGQVLFYNQTWAEELGFQTAPETAAEFKEQACAAAQANRLDADPENDGSGGWAVNTAPETILSWLYAFGSQVTEEDGRGYRFGNRESAAALAFLKNLYDSGCAWQSGEGLSGANFAEEDFATRRALFISASLADLNRQASALEQAGQADEWTVLPYPSSSERQRAITIYGPSLAILRASPEQQLAAWLFVRWLVSPEEHARLVSASGSFPLQSAEIDSLGENPQVQWRAALELLPFANPEPSYHSWSVVRWVVADVGTQVFRSYFTADRIPATLELMDATAADLHTREP